MSLSRLVAMAGAVLSPVGLALYVDRHGQRERARPCGAIVVLGAGVRAGGVASPSLRARAGHAARLYRLGYAPLVVCTGGVGAHPPSEAEVARRLVVDLGVPPAACLLEDQSTSTYENARCTAALLRPRGIREVVVVSDPYHLFRARQYFHREGLVAWTSPARRCARNLALPQRVWWTLREVAGLLARPELLAVRAPSIRQADARGQRSFPLRSSGRRG